MKTLKNEIEQLVRYCFSNKFDNVEEALEHVDMMFYGNAFQGTMLDDERGIAWVVSREDLENLNPGREISDDELETVVDGAFESISYIWDEQISSLMDEYNGDEEDE